MTYYIEQDGHVVLHDIDRKRLENTLMLMPQFAGLAVLETEHEIMDGHFVGSKEYVEHVKLSKLAQLKTAFSEELKRAHCPSSAGYRINANETADRNISSLIYAMEETGQETVPFCAYDNRFHEVSLDQLKTMKLEIITYVRAMYQRKWELRECIHAAKTIDEVNAIEIDFGLEEKIGHSSGLTSLSIR